MEINYWTGTEFEGGAYNESEEALVCHATSGRQDEAGNASATS